MIQTVMGKIPKEKAGIVLIHEHVLWGWINEVKQKYPKDEVKQIMLPLLKDLKKAGCSTLVEATTAGAGRDAVLLQELSQLAELNVITNCGVWDGLNRKSIYVPDFIKDNNEKEISRIWVNEFREGIDGTDIKPGFIKIAIGDFDEITPLHKKILQAAIRTSFDTNLCIQSHICASISPKQIVSILKKEKFPLERFIWCHADYPLDLQTNLSLAYEGIWVDTDWWLPKPESLYWHFDLIKIFKEKDLLNHLLISQDCGGFHDGKPSCYTIIFSDIIPKAIEYGISKEDFDILLIENPSRALSI